MKNILDIPRSEYIKKKFHFIEEIFNMNAAGSVDVDVSFDCNDQNDNHKSLPALVICQKNITIIINILKQVPPK